MADRKGGALYEQTLDIVTRFRELCTERFEGSGTIGVDGLLGEVVEEVGDEGPMGGLAPCRQGREVARACNVHLLVLFIDIVGHGVDRFPVVLGAGTADRVEVLKTESDGVDHPVALHAGILLGQFGHLFAHGEGGIELFVLERDGFRWRLEQTAENVAAQEDSAVNG